MDQTIRDVRSAMRASPLFEPEMRALAARIVDWYEVHGVRLGSAPSREAAGQTLQTWVDDEMLARMDAR